MGSVTLTLTKADSCGLLGHISCFFCWFSPLSRFTSHFSLYPFPSLLTIDYYMYLSLCTLLSIFPVRGVCLFLGVRLPSHFLYSSRMCPSVLSLVSGLLPFENNPLQHT